MDNYKKQARERVLKSEALSAYKDILLDDNWPDSHWIVVITAKEKDLVKMAEEVEALIFKIEKLTGILEQNG